MLKKKTKKQKTMKQQEQNQTLSALLALKLLCHYPGLSGTCSEDNWTYPGGQAHAIMIPFIDLLPSTVPELYIHSGPYIFWG